MSRVGYAFVLCLVGVAVSAACSLPPSDTCRRFVLCQSAVDPSVDTTPWESDGVCWRNLQTANVCDAQCAVALDGLNALPDPPAVCAAAAGG